MKIDKTYGVSTCCETVEIVCAGAAGFAAAFAPTDAAVGAPATAGLPFGVLFPAFAPTDAAVSAPAAADLPFGVLFPAFLPAFLPADFGPAGLELVSRSTFRVFQVHFHEN